MTNVLVKTVGIIIIAAVGVVAGMSFTACTYTINMVHSHGTATDVIDDTSTPTANTTATIPIKAI